MVAFDAWNFSNDIAVLRTEIDLLKAFGIVRYLLSADFVWISYEFEKQNTLFRNSTTFSVDTYREDQGRK